MSAGAISGRGQYSLANIVPHHKIITFDIFEEFRVFYDGGHYSLRGDIIHSDTGPPEQVDPGVIRNKLAIYSSVWKPDKEVQRLTHTTV